MGEHPEKHAAAAAGQARYAPSDSRLSDASAEVDARTARWRGWLAGEVIHIDD